MPLIIKKTNMKTPLLITIVCISLTLLNCSNSDNKIITEDFNQSEVITTAIITLTSNEDNDIVLTSKDPDGKGPLPPFSSVSRKLKANTTYYASIELRNEIKKPYEIITDEVEKEGKDHQFFYSSTADFVTFEYIDRDTNGDPIGLNFIVTTGAPYTGKISAILKHLPNKKAEGVPEGDVKNAGGETDIQVVFYDVIVE